MAIRDIIRMGDPRLLAVSDPVPGHDDPEVKDLVQDLMDTVASVGGAGLAAPQIGVLKRVFVYSVPPGRSLDTEEKDPPFTMKALLNPSWEPVGTEQSVVWEGCLSIPGLRGAVPRPERIRYRGTDMDGNPVEVETGGFHARVFQHEYDHLQGILYPMRMEDMRLFGFNEELSDLARAQQPVQTEAETDVETEAARG